MKKLFSALLVLSFVLCLFTVTASAGNSISDYSDDHLKQLYEMVRDEMIKRGLPLAQEITLREGKFIIGQDIQAGTYTLKCTETFGETYGDAYSSLGGLFGGDLGGMMNSLGGMMGDMINAEAEILGNYGTVLKSYELKTGDSVRITLEEGTALQLSDGAFILIAD